MAVEDGVRSAERATAPLTGELGGAGTRLLAGPPRAAGPESHAAHQRRLGTCRIEDLNPSELRCLIAESGLGGRGGAMFPTARKLELAAASPGPPLVVVNASEGEPASRKDRTLLAHRPHLVLDGAMVAARACGAEEILFYLHRARRDTTMAVESALTARPDEAARVRLVDAPARYLAGESSALVSYLSGDGAIPRGGRAPVAAVGVRGRPTVVNNAETVAHLALLARFGAQWYREAGDPEAPGSTLVTLAGAVGSPGTVVEVVGPATFGDLLARHAGVEVPSAVLVGGYGGTWLDGAAAWRAPLTRGALRARGVSLGCGVVAVLGDAQCGVRTTARLVRWLAGESAGQCGPCVFGLPELAELLSALAVGDGTGRDVRRLRVLAATLRGRGACGHPTGVVELVESALTVFTADLEEHAHGRPCGRPAAALPTPGTASP